MSFCLPGTSDSLNGGLQAGLGGGRGLQVVRPCDHGQYEGQETAEMDRTPRLSPITKEDEGISVLIHYTQGDDNLAQIPEMAIAAVVEDVLTQASIQVSTEQEEFDDAMVDGLLEEINNISEEIDHISSDQHNELMDSLHHEFKVNNNNMKMKGVQNMGEELSVIINDTEAVIDTMLEEEKAMAAFVEEVISQAASLVQYENDMMSELLCQIILDEEASLISDAAIQSAIIKFEHQDILNDISLFEDDSNQLSMKVYAQEVVANIISSAIEECETDLASEECVSYVLHSILREEEEDMIICNVVASALDKALLSATEKSDEEGLSNTTNEEEDVKRFVNELVTNVLDMAVSSAEEGLDLAAENFVSEVLANIQEEDASRLRFVNEAMISEISDKEDLSFKTAKLDTEKCSNTKEDRPTTDISICERPRTWLLPADMTTVSSEPVLGSRQLSQETLGISTPNITGLEVSVTVLSGGQLAELPHTDVMDVAKAETTEHLKETLKEPRRQQKFGWGRCPVYLQSHKQVI